MGGVPLTALNVVGFPDNLDTSILVEILKGGASKCLEAGVIIVGGHTVTDPEPKYGLAVTGTVTPGSQISNSGAQEGDLLVLTKPLGTGIITTAGKQGTIDQNILDEAVELMATLNKGAAVAMISTGVSACSDITGFGLLGHAAEMCRSSDVSFQINYNDLIFFPGVKELAKEGIIPGGSKRNLSYAKRFTDFSKSISGIEMLMVADAQTSGGLLIALSKENAGQFLDYYNNKSSIPAIQIGSVHTKNKSLITVS